MARGRRAVIEGGNGDLSDDGGTGELATRVVDPGDFDGASGGTGAGGDTGPELTPTGRVKRKRGPNKAKAPLDIKGLQGTLLNIHAMLAAMMATPELALLPGEAEQLAQVLAANARHYNIPAVTEKVSDGINLAMVLFAVYAPRLAAVKMRKGAAKQPRDPGMIEAREPPRQPGPAMPESFQHLQ